MIQMQRPIQPELRRPEDREVVLDRLATLHKRPPKAKVEPAEYRPRRRGQRPAPTWR